MSTTPTTPNPVYTCGTCGDRVYPDKRTKRLLLGIISKKIVCNYHYQHELNIEQAMFESQFGYDDWED